MKLILHACLLSCLALATPAWAGVDLAAIGQRIESADHRADSADLQAVCELLQAAPEGAAPDKYLHYYRGYADYVSAYLLSRDDSDRATDLVQEAESELQEALKLDPDFAEAEALLGASYGLEIGLHPFRGMWLGSKAGSHTERALQLAPADPRVLLLRAISDYFTPSVFGGDKQRALQEFRAALAAFDSYHSADDAAPGWGRAETYAWLGLAESRDGQTEAARADLSKALELAPDYVLARKQLMALPPAAGMAAGPATTH
jgi:tetratricopeptide (TPR) repeat protein